MTLEMVQRLVELKQAAKALVGPQDPYRSQIERLSHQVYCLVDIVTEIVDTIVVLHTTDNSLDINAGQ